MKQAQPIYSGADIETMTAAQSAQIKEQARALGAVHTSQADADPVTVAGGAMDRRGIPLLRLILSLAALLIIYVDPSGPDRHVAFTYSTLALYVLYSAAAYIAVYARGLTLAKRAAHWIDTAWHTLLVSLSSGTNSLFFFFYFFDILVASFRRGAAEGFRVAVVATVLFASAGYAFPQAHSVELNHVFLRPVYLLVFGSMIACWGGLEHRLKRRLALLKEATVPSNPRFGVHQTITSALDKLRDFYDAETCLLVIADGADGEHWLYQTRRGDARGQNPERCAPEMAAVLLRPPFSLAMLVERRSVLRPLVPSVYIQDVVTGGTLRELPESARLVVSALDADSVATVPLRYHHEAVGRLYVTGRARTFDTSDLDFLSHAMHATLRVADNVRLVDRLASEAAEHERKRIARSIHDTVIQPYIGLQLGLGSVLHRLKEGDRLVETDVGRLLSVIDAEVHRLRHYVSDLKGMPDERIAFMPAITRLARQFTELTGIDVNVDGPANLALSDRLGAELFEMTAEALSNVRRHTGAHRAEVVVRRTDHAIALRVENDAGGEVQPFDPRSLGEHAHALGGSLDIHRSAGTTAVVISIPL